MGIQPGILNGYGLNNIGLLVQIAGKVTYSTAAGSPPHYFVVDDGSGKLDPTGFPGVGVRCGSLNPPNVNQYVNVIGISSIESGCPVVLVRQSGDWW